MKKLETVSKYAAYYIPYQSVLFLVTIFLTQTVTQEEIPIEWIRFDENLEGFFCSKNNCETKETLPIKAIVSPNVRQNGIIIKQFLSSENGLLYSPNGSLSIEDKEDTPLTNEKEIT